MTNGHKIAQVKEKSEKFPQKFQAERKSWKEIIFASTVAAKGEGFRQDGRAMPVRSIMNNAMIDLTAVRLQ
jgi:hypothetical protein